ncbi:hypothetical protein HPB48_004398 [Haemaphysalis longicornis]|uniref:Coronin n=1 Tax=Haemaphysalis longicornis TaxID=44386 RepID=A0A9J6G1G6_HAELO|nr:hypothetical protein HPB48_004398 [Haemaphysalis longicornis]
MRVTIVGFAGYGIVERLARKRHRGRGGETAHRKRWRGPWQGGVPLRSSGHDRIGGPMTGRRQVWRPRCSGLLPRAAPKRLARAAAGTLRWHALGQTTPASVGGSARAFSLDRRLKRTSCATCRETRVASSSPCSGTSGRRTARPSSCTYMHATCVYCDRVLSSLMGAVALRCSTICRCRNARLSSSVSKGTSFRGVRSSKFRHVFGSPARKGQCYECVKITKDAHDSHFCAVNPKFIAIVTESAGGGSFLVIPIEHTGRVEVTAGKVTGHKGPVLDLKWNPFNDNVIASCSDDCTVKIWYIPEEGLLRNTNLVEPLVDLRGHRRRVGYVEWHPTAENILLSAGFDHLILVWDVSHGDVVHTIDCHPDSIHSMSFNRDGSLLATTCKDKKLRIIDPRACTVIREGVCHQGSKASKVVFLGDTGRLFTTGFSRFSDRQWAVWSQHDLSKPLRTENIDSSSGVLFPYYDHDTKMVYVAGKGDGNIRYYELVNEAPWCHYLSQFLTGCPQRGLGCMPKRGLDVRSCEVFRFYKLHATRGLCEPVSMIVPRKARQGQLYPGAQFEREKSIALQKKKTKLKRKLCRDESIHAQWCCAHCIFFQLFVKT